MLLTVETWPSAAIVDPGITQSASAIVFVTVIMAPPEYHMIYTCIWSLYFRIKAEDSEIASL